MNYRLSQRGFSLIELMVVVILIGLVIAIVSPNFSTYTRNRQFEASARRVVADLRQARTIAIGQHHRTRINFDAANNSYTILIDSNDNETFEPEEVSKTVVLIDDYPIMTFGRLSSVTTSPVPLLSGGTSDAIALGPDDADNDWTGFNYIGGALRDADNPASQVGAIFIKFSNSTGGPASSEQLAVSITTTGTVKAWRFNGTIWIDML